MRSIRSKIIAVTIAAILISNLAFLSVFFTTVAKENTSMAARQLNLMTQNLQKTLDSYLDSIDQSVDMAAHIATDSLDSLTLVETGVIGSTARENGQTPAQKRALAAYLREHCDRVQDAFYSVANHTNGVVSYYYCINPEVSTREHGFIYSKLGKAGFEEQEPIDASLLDSGDMAHNAWYFLPIQRGRPSWVGPYSAQILGEMQALSYLAPIYKSGVLIGVLGMDIPFDTLADQVGELKVYETGFAFLLDESGRVLYHPTLEAGMMPEDASRLMQSEQFRQKSSSEPIRYEKNGKTWQLSFATLSSGMKLMVTAPVDEINGSFFRLTEIILYVALATIAVFSVLTLLIIRAFTDPLRRLTAASQRLAAGDYEVELDYNGKDEVGVLTGAYRQMRDHLKLYISDLNSRAFSDALTGVKNKGAFDIYLGRLNDAIRLGGNKAQTAFGIVMFDCNGLKTINDSYGHQRGDVYLRAACSAICRTYAHSPVFRVGGDEFVALLQRQDYAEREALLQRLDRLIEEENAKAGEPWERVSLARGMAVFAPGRDTSAEQVLSRADEQMYEDKRHAGSGRG